MNRIEFQKTVKIGDYINRGDDIFVFEGYNGNCHQLGVKRGKPYLCHICKGELILRGDCEKIVDCLTLFGDMRVSIDKTCTCINKNFLEEALFEI